MSKAPDFSGWATKNDLRCADDLIIKKNAFAINDGKDVPLVYNHDHKNITSIIGHANLENRDEGVYAYCYLNGTKEGQHAKEAVNNGDVTSLSIWANNLQRVGNNIVHGIIREVSLVLAGANPGASIESVMAHGIPMDPDDDEGILYSGESIYIEHSVKDDDGEEEMNEEEKNTKNNTKNNTEKESKDSGRTVGEIFDEFTDEQKLAVATIIDQIIKDNGGSSTTKEEEEEVKHNIFDRETNQVNVLSHDSMNQIFRDAKRLGSLRDAVRENLGDDEVIAHSIDTTGMTTATGEQRYGFNDASMLFPDYRSLNNPPEWISRNMDWVQALMGSVSHTPFSRIKSIYADITENDARAMGYIKGKQKKDEVFTTLKRTTDPQTIYKRQKLDRDDIKDITDFDVVAWIRAEMRVMLNEEIARAILIGDGRASSSDDKISEDHIRPIVNDVPLFNIKYAVNVSSTATDDDIAKAAIRGAVKGRIDYKGSGNPTLFTTEKILTNMLLLEDTIGHKLYKTEQELATAMRVSKIVTVELMEGAKVSVTADGSTTQKDLIGVIVNPRDYNVGADKGGQVDMFDDFDIDYNQQKYLIETRISGALVKPYSAITLYLNDTIS